MSPNRLLQQLVLSLASSLVTSPHAPGCLPHESAMLVGTDGGASTLSLTHDLGQAAVALVKEGKSVRAQSSIVTGLQRKHGLSFHGGTCFSTYIQCTVGAANCASVCLVDFKSAECKICAADECGQALLHCTRAAIVLPSKTEL